MKKVLKWLDNIWYHYKVIIMVGGFLLICVVIMLTQFVQRDKYDAMILYTGPHLPTAVEILDIQSSFESVMKEDYDGNGAKDVALSSLFLMTEEQLEDEKYYTDAEGNQVYINAGEMVTTRQQFSTQIFAGETLICLLDPAWYDMAKKQDAFVPISELTDKKFDCMYDESALYFRDTPFGEYFDSAEAFPEDTLICFRRVPTVSGLVNAEKEKKRYNFNRDFFIDILEFEIH